MKTAFDVVKTMLRTEKGHSMLPQNKYVFEVSGTANKIEIKKAVEELYKVKVDAVHVVNVKGKLRRVRFREGMTSSWKKAIVTLKPESKIEVT
ncbi:MAG: 50S ribosomal protein L23 [Candidatus Omnitrophica bacterium]|jgi:large subunit ribosomal protein L23|nr:50S ribosomal protein L23 [Candidatus Omnitrophota bacterium]MDD4012865.1 50S ribosomal protein L23 [Candidatus Omnitrophota bacterium]